MNQNELFPDSPADAGLTQYFRRAGKRGSAFFLVGAVFTAAMEIARLDILLEKSPGITLTGPEAVAILSSLKLYEDTDDSGDFDAAFDTLIETLDLPSPVDGVVEFTMGDFGAPVNAGQIGSYLLIAELTPDAMAQTVDNLRLTLLTTRSRLEDATFDTPLVLRSPEDVPTPLLVIEPVLLFSDGFESGDTTVWAATFGLP